MRPPPPVELDYWEVPAGIWRGEAVAILGGGASLTQKMADHLRGQCRVIAVNRAGVPQPRGHQGRWVYVPWADWLFASDADKFWQWHPEAVDFPGIKIAVRGVGIPNERWHQLKALADQGVKILRHSGEYHSTAADHEGISAHPGVVRGNNACQMLMSVLLHTGLSTLMLFGMDQRGEHWHGGYAGRGAPDYAVNVIPNFRSLVEPYVRADCPVLNCSPKSALPWWWRVRVEDVL